MLLILDVDETLIHSSRTRTPGSIYAQGLYADRRPYLDQFIDLITDDGYFDVGVWSAGTYDYVWDIVEAIFPYPGRLEFVMTREDCVPIERNGYDDFFKPLSIAEEEYGTSNILLIDNKPDVTTDSLRQILIKDYFHDQSDTELVKLWNHLDENRHMGPEWLSVNWH